MNTNAADLKGMSKVSNTDLTPDGEKKVGCPIFSLG